MWENWKIHQDKKIRRFFRQIMTALYLKMFCFVHKFWKVQISVLRCKYNFGCRYFQYLSRYVLFIPKGLATQKAVMRSSVRRSHESLLCMKLDQRSIDDTIDQSNSIIRCFSCMCGQRLTTFTYDKRRCGLPLSAQK